MLYPLKLKPAWKDYLWGGKRLKEEYQYETEMDPIAEAWVLSCHKDGLATVENGIFAGKSLAEVLKKDILQGIGTKYGTDFPVLVKLIDANKDLSIQVHPDDEFAYRVEGEPGKTEMWYIIDCKPGACLYYGFSRKISRAEFKERIQNNTLIEILNKVEVKKGDTFFIRSGTIHAICGGIMLSEIQQNSNITYRVYDYGRVGVDGKSRPLHIEQALKVTDTSFVPGNSQKREFETVDGNRVRHLADCKYFKVDWIETDEEMKLLVKEESFQSVLFLEGRGKILWGKDEIEYKKGDCFYLPAGMGECRIQGKCELLLVK